MTGHLDAASGAPLHPAARAALTAAWAEGWADPIARHGAGRRARQLLDAAREVVADCLGARPDEVSFTANATQARHAAVLGAAAGGRRRGATVVHSAVEHSAVLEAVRANLASGGAARSVPVDSRARVDAAAFVAALRAPGVGLGVLQAASHEVGTRQPVTEVAAGAPEVPLVVDAAQTAGREPVPVGWSVLVADARAWGGPTLGVLAVRTGTRWQAGVADPDREYGRVPGLPPVPEIVAAAAALRAVTDSAPAESARQRLLIDRVRAGVAATVPDVQVLGDPIDRVPHIVTFSCLYASGEAVLDRLDRLGFAVSSGSSCTASALEPSHVLVAMGALTSGNVRVSVGPDTSEADVDRFLAVLPGVLADVRSELGAEGL